MDAAEQLLPPPSSMSAAKQDRILIWRSEVELATAALEPDVSNDGASSRHGGSSSSSTTAASSSSSRSALVLARGRQVLAKVIRRLSWRPWRGAGGDGPGGAPAAAAAAAAMAGHEGPTRTAMYATLSPDYRPPPPPSREDEQHDADADGAPFPSRTERQH
ncbi:hypothetical protein V2A60_001059 [Cordyceps javanica]